MKRNLIYHNPRCSKSRQTLALLQKRCADVDVIEYLKSPPAKRELKFICQQLGIQPTGIMRTKEKTFADLGLSVHDKRSPEEWIDILIENPILIERPIVVYKGKAAVGRPPENVLKIL